MINISKSYVFLFTMLIFKSAILEAQDNEIKKIQIPVAIIQNLNNDTLLNPIYSCISNEGIDSFKKKYCNDPKIINAHPFGLNRLSFDNQINSYAKKLKDKTHLSDLDKDFLDFIKREEVICKDKKKYVNEIEIEALAIKETYSTLNNKKEISELVDIKILLANNKLFPYRNDYFNGERFDFESNSAFEITFRSSSFPDIQNKAIELAREGEDIKKKLSIPNEILLYAANQFYIDNRRNDNKFNVEEFSKRNLSKPLEKTSYIFEFIERIEAFRETQDKIFDLVEKKNAENNFLVDDEGINIFHLADYYFKKHIGIIPKSHEIEQKKEASVELEYDYKFSQENENAGARIKGWKIKDAITMTKVPMRQFLKEQGLDEEVIKNYFDGRKLVTSLKMSGQAALLGITRDNSKLIKEFTDKVNQLEREYINA